MAEAACTVRHYVSDCLEERHPYDARKAFAGRPERDYGLVYAGLQPYATDNWIASISDPSVGGAQRVRALRLLTAHSASQELKVSLLRKGIVPVLAAALQPCGAGAGGAVAPTLQPLAPPPAFECAAHELLRSLCVLPQGCEAVIADGGLAAVLRSVTDSSDPISDPSGAPSDDPPSDPGKDAPSDPGKDSLCNSRGPARTAAARVLRQLCVCVNGARRLLAADVPEGFALSPRTHSEPFGGAPPPPEDVMGAIVYVLRSETTEQREGQQQQQQQQQQLVLHVVAALALLCAQTEGIFVALRCGALDAVADLLRRDAMDPSRLTDIGAAAVAVESLTVVWNIALEQSGADCIDEAHVPRDLFLLLAALYKEPLSPEAGRGPLLRSLTGALAAVYKLLSVKRGSLNVLDGTRSRIRVLFEFLRSVNNAVDAARQEQREPHVDIVSMSKNLVLCVRFASEVKAVRDFAYNYLRKMDNGGGTEAFYLRRQLYYSTIWEAEFDAAV